MEESAHCLTRQESYLWQVLVSTHLAPGITAAGLLRTYMIKQKINSVLVQKLQSMCFVISFVTYFRGLRKQGSWL